MIIQSTHKTHKIMTRNDTTTSGDLSNNKFINTLPETEEHKFTSSIFANARGNFARLIFGLRNTVYLACFATILFFVSVASYFFIYWLLMRNDVHAWPIYFDYNLQSEQCQWIDENNLKERVNCPLSSAVLDDNGTSPSNETLSEEYLHRIPNKFNDQQCPPTAFVSLISGYNQWRAYDADILPRRKNSKGSRILKTKRPHFIQVVLTLPENFVNHEIGVFMVEVKLRDIDGNPLAISSRPAMLPYESVYVSTVRKSLLMGPLMLGTVMEAKTIIVDCFDHFYESLEKPLVCYLRATILSMFSIIFSQ